MSHHCTLPKAILASEPDNFTHYVDIVSTVMLYVAVITIVRNLTIFELANCLASM